MLVYIAERMSIAVRIAGRMPKILQIYMYNVYTHICVCTRVKLPCTGKTLIWSILNMVMRLRQPNVDEQINASENACDCVSSLFSLVWFRWLVGRLVGRPTG